MARTLKSSLYIKSYTGNTIYFRRADLQRKIQKATNQTGHKDCWLAEDLSYAIEKYLETIRDAEEELVEESTVDKFVVNLLTDAGFHEEAHQYAVANESRFREDSSGKDPESWNRERIEELLGKNPLFQNYDSKLIIEGVIDSLEKLSFYKVTDDFITELGSHIITNSLKADDSCGGNTLFLFSREELQQKSPIFLQRLYHDGIITAREISRLFPKLHLDFNIHKYTLANFAEEDLVMLELAFLPKLTAFVREVAKNYNELINLTGHSFMDVSMPYMFTVQDLGNLLDTTFTLHGQYKASLKDEISSIIRTSFNAHCEAKVQLVYY